MSLEKPKGTLKHELRTARDLQQHGIEEEIAKSIVGYRPNEVPFIYGTGPILRHLPNGKGEYVPGETELWVGTTKPLEEILSSGRPLRNNPDVIVQWQRIAELQEDMYKDETTRTELKPLPGGGFVEVTYTNVSSPGCFDGEIETVYVFQPEKEGERIIYRGYRFYQKHKPLPDNIPGVGLEMPNPDLPEWTNKSPRNTVKPYLLSALDTMMNLYPDNIHVMKEDGINLPVLTQYINRNRNLATKIRKPESQPGPQCQEKPLERKITNSARRRYLLGRNFFERNSGRPDPLFLIRDHENWVKKCLKEIGVDPSNIYKLLFSPSKHPEWGPFLEVLKASSRNILQALCWYEAPEYSSSRQPKLTFPADEIIYQEEEIWNYIKEQLPSQPQQRYIKSLLRNYNPPSPEQRGDDFPLTFEVNEHYEGIKGRLIYKGVDFADATLTTGPKRPHLLIVEFKPDRSFIGWYQYEDRTFSYKLTGVMDMIRTLYLGVTDREPVIKITTRRFS